MDLIAALIIGRINARNDKILLVTDRKTEGSGLINAFKRLNSKGMAEYLLKTREKALFLIAFILYLMALTQRVETRQTEFPPIYNTVARIVHTGFQMKTRNKILTMLTGICLTVLSSTGSSPYTVAVGVAAKVNPDGVAAAVVKPVKEAAVGGAKAAGKAVVDTYQGF